MWVSSRSWWWTGEPGELQSVGSQRVGHNWATELKWGDNSKQRRNTHRNASDLHFSYYTQFHNNHTLSKGDKTCCQGTAHLGQPACRSSEQQDCDHEMGCKTLRKTGKGPNRARSNGQAKAADHRKPGYLFPVSELGKIGKAWRQKEEGAAEDAKVREHHWLNGLEFEQIPRDSGGQWSLECYIQGVDLATGQQWTGTRNRCIPPQLLFPFLHWCMSPAEVAAPHPAVSCSSPACSSAALTTPLLFANAS